MRYIFAIMLLNCAFNTIAQTNSVKPILFDGILVLGIVNKGGFVNFSGPSISATLKDSKFIIGMLPSLRFRVDNKTPNNSFLTPSLGVGITYCYKFLSAQVPIFYDPKTINSNGKWRLGLGIGLRLNGLNKQIRP